LWKTTSNIMIPKFRVVKRKRKTLSIFNIHNQTNHICWFRRSIIRIQFSIQLTVAKTIHCFLGLSSDELVFDPTNVKRHGLTYINIILHSNKRKIIFVSSCSTWNFLCGSKNTYKNWIDWKPLQFRYHWFLNLKTYIIFM
jgi:hypothetical protein